MMRFKNLIALPPIHADLMIANQTAHLPVKAESAFVLLRCEPPQVILAQMVVFLERRVISVWPIENFFELMQWIIVIRNRLLSLSRFEFSLPAADPDHGSRSTRDGK